MARKILQEMRLHRDEDGSHIVEHHHAEHKAEAHRFKKGTAAVEHILNNVHKLEPKGTMRPDIEEQEESEPNSWAGRPASFDYGSRGGGRISGTERRR